VDFDAGEVGVRLEIQTLQTQETGAPRYFVAARNHEKNFMIEIASQCAKAISNKNNCHGWKLGQTLRAFADTLIRKPS
jgi:hypothetical protein